MGDFKPPSKPPYLRFAKIPDEALDMLGAMNSRAQYDKLCGAIVRYMLSGEREDVPQAIRPHYHGLIGNMDRIRQGAKNRYNGRVAKSEGDFESKRDENATRFESKVTQERSQNATENAPKTRLETGASFYATTTLPPAETQESVSYHLKDQLGNQTTKHLGNQTTKHLGNQRYESESESESARGFIRGNAQERMADSSDLPPWEEQPSFGGEDEDPFFAGIAEQDFEW